MISCTDFMAEMGSYLDGEAAAELRAHLEIHLAHCQSCQVIYDSTRKTLQIVTDSGCFELPQTTAKPIVESVMARVRSAHNPSKTS